MKPLALLLLVACGTPQEPQRVSCEELAAQKRAIIARDPAGVQPVTLAAERELDAEYSFRHCTVGLLTVSRGR